MIRKVVANTDVALDGIADGMTLMVGGFGLCGIPENLIAAVATGSDVSAISAASSTGSEVGLTEATGGTADGGSEISLPPPVISPEDIGVRVVSPEDGG